MENIKYIKNNLLIVRLIVKYEKNILNNLKIEKNNLIKARNV